MKKATYCLLIAALFLGACGSSKKVVKADAKPATQTATAVADGSSFEKAIVIKANKDMAGVAEEYAWIRANYPGAKTKGQSLVNKENKAYDILKIVTADGTEKSIYFDITNSFGKF